MNYTFMVCVACLIVKLARSAERIKDWIYDVRISYIDGDGVNPTPVSGEAPESVSN